MESGFRQMNLLVVNLLDVDDFLVSIDEDAIHISNEKTKTGR
jgi:hypothetical protein